MIQDRELEVNHYDYIIDVGTMTQKEIYFTGLAG